MMKDKLAREYGSEECITTGGPKARRDATLLAAYFGPQAQGLPPGEMTEREVTQLRRNKLGPLAHGETEAGKAWSAMLAEAAPIFEASGAGWVLMKALASPFAVMSDIDFLLPDPSGIARVAAALEERKYRLYRFRLLAHPLKVMAVPEGQSIKEPPAVDIYPDAMWVRKHVLDGPGVITRRRPAEVRGVRVYSPSPEDDLYLVATHAFSHGTVHLAELDHGARLIASCGSTFDWDRLLRMAEGFGCLDSLYLYLALLDSTEKAVGGAGTASVPAVAIRWLSGRPVNAQVGHWLRAVQPSLSFPLRVPLLLGTLHSALHHLPALVGKVRPRELVMDAAVHGFALGTHLLRRD